MKKEICKNCKKWLRYLQKQDRSIGVCREIENGHSGKYIGHLSHITTECRNYSPLTFWYIGCEEFEPKLKHSKILH